MKKSGAFALCVALCGLTVLLGSTREAEAATTTVNAVLQGSSDCNSSCCPSNVQVTVNVDPTTGLWTAQVNGVPVGGNPNNPVPLPVTEPTVQSEGTQGDHPQGERGSADGDAGALGEQAAVADGRTRRAD